MKTREVKMKPIMRSTSFPLQRILQPLDLQLLVKKHNAIFLKELSSRFYSMQTKNFYSMQTNFFYEN